jgi:hypothetical protein
VVLTATWVYAAFAGCDPAVLARVLPSLPPGAPAPSTTWRAVALYVQACGGPVEVVASAKRDRQAWQSVDRALATADPAWPNACPGGATLAAEPSRAQLLAACGASPQFTAAEWATAEGASFLPFLADRSLAGVPDGSRRVLVRALAGLSEPAQRCDVTKLAPAPMLEGLVVEQRAGVALRGYADACRGVLSDPAGAVSESSPAFAKGIAWQWTTADPAVWRAACPAWPEGSVEPAERATLAWTTCPHAQTLATSDEWTTGTGYPALAIGIYADLVGRPEVPAALARATARAVMGLPPSP